MSTYDKLFILDIRQRLSQEKIEQLKNPKLISSNTKVSNIIGFKNSRATFIQLTDDVYAAPPGTYFRDLTARSKIIIRGHGGTGLHKVSSDEFTIAGKMHNTTTENLVKKIEDLAKEVDVLSNKKNDCEDLVRNLMEGFKKNYDPTIEELYFITLYEESINKGQKKQSLEDKVNSIYRNRFLSDPNNVVQKQQLKQQYIKATSDYDDSKKQYISAITQYNQTISDWKNAIKADPTKTLERSFTADELAEFLWKQIGPIAPENYGQIQKRAAQGQVTKSIVRRLTFQCAMCHGGEAKQGNSPSAAFCDVFRKALSDKGLEANVVGYLASTRFLANQADVNKVEFEYDQMGGGFTQTTKKIGVKSTGVNIEGGTGNNKVIFTLENPRGMSYNLWKGTNFTGNQGPMVDLLAEMQTEIWSAHWANEGKKLFGTKVPDGIVKLRQVLPIDQDLESITPTQLKGIWAQIKDILAAKVATTRWSRKAVTNDIYTEYDNAMKGY